MEESLKLKCSGQDFIMDNGQSHWGRWKKNARNSKNCYYLNHIVPSPDPVLLVEVTNAIRQPLSRATECEDIWLCFVFPHMVFLFCCRMSVCVYLLETQNVCLSLAPTFPFTVVFESSCSVTGSSIPSYPHVWP